MKKFVGYITFGYPDIKETRYFLKNFEDWGIDIVEIGIPFSDPVADGPTIQLASDSSLKKRRFSIDEILDEIKSLNLKIPVVILTYFNPIFNYGIEKFLKKAKNSRIWGVIIPDLLFEEGRRWRVLCKKYKIKNIELVSPVTPFKRIKKIIKETRGFLYYVSVTGVTGARRDVQKALIKRLQEIKKIEKKVPVYLGFGFSNKEQIKKVIDYADGVIIGSAIIEKLKNRKKTKHYIINIAKFIHKF